jgi:hypothetical protein
MYIAEQAAETSWLGMTRFSGERYTVRKVERGVESDMPLLQSVLWRWD